MVGFCTHPSTRDLTLEQPVCIFMNACVNVCRYEMLVVAGMQPDRVTFNTLLKACMRGNLADKALLTFDKMRQLKIPVGFLCFLEHRKDHTARCHSRDCSPKLPLGLSQLGGIQGRVGEGGGGTGVGVRGERARVRLSSLPPRQHPC